MIRHPLPVPCPGLRRVRRAAPALSVTLAALLSLAACSRPAGSPVTGRKGAVSAPSGAETLAAIERVLAAYEVLARVRNHASETAPVADAVRDYVAGLESLDFSATPAAFEAAFARHRAAWEAAIPVLEPHAELRGEMHAVLEEIRRRDDARILLEEAEARIWGSWAEVERVARTHGALPEETAD